MNTAGRLSHNLLDARPRTAAWQTLKFSALAALPNALDRSTVPPSAQYAGQERQHVLRPDVAPPPDSAEAMRLQILRDVLRIDLSGVRFPKPPELAAKNAARFQTVVLRWLNQKHRDLDPSHGLDEAVLQRRVAARVPRRR